MATKAQKRAAALEKREKFLADHRAAGLEAQRQDRVVRERHEREAREEAIALESRLLRLMLENLVHH